MRFGRYPVRLEIPTRRASGILPGSSSIRLDETASTLGIPARLL